MSGKSAFQHKLSNFKSRFQSLLGAKAQGYDELNTLERPLVSDVHEQEEYERQHGTTAPAGFYPATAGGGGGEYRPPQTGGHGYPPPPSSYPAPAHGRTHAPMPSQADELQELSLLARDAAEILWEMVAMGEGGAAQEDMKGKAQQLQAQLRGLISDYQEGDETILARAFESFDMLSRCLEELQAPQPAAVPAAGIAAAGTTAPVGLAPPPPAATAPAAAPVVSRPPADEAPLISFD